MSIGTMTHSPTESLPFDQRQAIALDQPAYGMNAGFSVTRTDATHPPVTIDYAPQLDALTARVAALEALPTCTESSILRRLTSRKLWVTIAAVLATLLTWLHGNLSGQYAAPIIGGVTVVYLVVQAAIDNTQVAAQAAATRMLKVVRR